MAKELLIMRHAKSSWGDESLSDHDRPLNKRGNRDAPRMASFLIERDLIPDIIISSSANRARSTAEIVFETLDNSDIPISCLPDLYLASPDIYLEIMCNLDDRFERPLLIGHNPGLEHLVNVLTQASEFMSTAAIAHVQLEIDNWNDTSEMPIRSRLRGVFRPKEVS